MQKKGISPVMATILLVSLAVTLAIFILGWGTNFVNNLSPPVNCDNVNFKIDFISIANTHVLQIENIGTTQLEGFIVKFRSEGDITEIENLELNVEPGATQSVQIKNFKPEHIDQEFLIVPKISAQSKEKTLIKSCPDKFGETTTLN